MFRTGGSAEGITSGLDVPKLNASRQNFQEGGDDMESRYNRAMDFIKSKQTARSSDFNDFLINLGLDLVSRPRSGNIFQQVATSAAGPYQRFTERKSTARQEQDKLSQALIGDIMEQMSEEKIAEIEARGESGKRQFEYKGKYEDYQALIKQQRELEDRKRKLEEQNVATKDLQTDEVVSAQYDEEIRRINAQLEDNAKLQNLFQDKEEDAVRAAILKGISNGIFTFDDLITYDETGVPPREGSKDGGRIGLQMGGQPMPAAMPTDQGPVEASPVQSLTFEELRARLPQTITDDIVTLIASSEQALADFANIQTQQDVNAFNQKYEVNLQLPAEA
jgi:hypothetical protein